MKKYLTSGKILIILLSVLLTAGSFAAIPLLRSWWKPAEKVVAETPPSYGKKETELLKGLLAVYARIDTLQVLDMGGQITTTDPSDPVNNLRADFNYCKKGELIYYRLGDNEMVQLPDVNISANSTVKKMFVTPPKQIITAPHLPVDSIIALWQNDSYTVSSTEIDEQVTITFLCEEHVTCKELKITYNRASHKMNNVYMRLTNLSDPLNKKLDREVNVVFNRWEEVIAAGKYFTLSDYVTQKAGVWQPAAGYSSYRLISAL
jgi:hypothetical protein